MYFLWQCCHQHSCHLLHLLKLVFLVSYCPFSQVNTTVPLKKCFSVFNYYYFPSGLASCDHNGRQCIHNTLNKDISWSIWAFPVLMTPQSIFWAFFTAVFFLGLGINKEQIHQLNGGPYLFLSSWMLIKDNKPRRSFLCCSKLTVTSAPLTLTHTWPDGVRNHGHWLSLRRQVCVNAVSLRMQNSHLRKSEMRV